MQNLSNRDKIVNLNLKVSKMSFLPSDYEAPRTNNNFMRIQNGENKIRILSSPILGWEDWNDKVPVRYRYHEKPDSSIDPSKPLRHFWSMIVFNYNEESIQILHLVQATVRNGIEKLVKDEDWGAPYNYDIKIFKEGEQEKTKYSVNPLPHKPVGQYILDQFREKPCYLEAMFSNDDPFSPRWDIHTPLMIEEVEQIKSDGNISALQAKQLKDLLFQDIKSDEALKLLLAKAKCTSIEQIKEEKFSGAFNWLKERIDSQKGTEEVPF